MSEHARVRKYPRVGLGADAAIWSEVWQGAVGQAHPVGGVMTVLGAGGAFVEVSEAYEVGAATLGSASSCREPETRWHAMPSSVSLCPAAVSASSSPKFRRSIANAFGRRPSISCSGEPTLGFAAAARSAARTLTGAEAIGSTRLPWHRPFTQVPNES